MLAIDVELLHETFRADPDGSANTGRLSRGEWPPAPARLFAALVAADGTGERCRVTDGSELEWMERLPPPVIHAHDAPWHQPLRPRYVAKHAGGFAKKYKKGKPTSTSACQEYVGRIPIEIRPGVRVAPRTPRIVYVWDVPAPDEVVDALRRRAARVGYLGAADSPVRLRIQTDPSDINEHQDAFVPDPAGSVVIRVPQKGHLAVLDAVYDAWMERGANIALSQFPALRHQIAYRAPGSTVPQDLGGVVAWLRLGYAVSGRRVSALTELFKKAALRRYQELHGEPPPVLHGHGFEERGYDLARFLALPDVGYAQSRGRIHGLALWLPAGCPMDVRWRVTEAAHAIRRLKGGGVDVSVRPRTDEVRPVAALPARWMRTSRCWVTAFPAVHERRGELDIEEVARWCRHAGLPAPHSFRSARGPLVRGAVDLAPIEVNRPGRPGLPYSHVKICFDQPVKGPVAIGAGRQRGLGLCVDVTDREDDE